jgi:hypothetical protein
MVHVDVDRLRLGEKPAWIEEPDRAGGAEAGENLTTRDLLLHRRFLRLLLEA